MRQGILSVIIPTLNRKQYLQELLVSVFQEEIPELELVVVDDGSTDGTCEAIGNLNIRYIRLEENRGRGPARPRNVGFAASSGEYVTFLDSDDLVARGGLRARLNFLLRDPKALAVGGQIAGYIDRAGKDLLSVKNPNRLPSLLCKKSLEGSEKFTRAVWPYIFTRSLLEKVGPFDESLKIIDDLEMLHRIVRHTSIPVLDFPCVYYRMHDDNISFDLKSNGLEYKSRLLVEMAMFEMQTTLTVNQ